jgi:hypothetical protein
VSWEVDLDTIAGFRTRLPVPWRGPDIVEAGPDEAVIASSWRVLHRVFAEPPMPPVDRATNGLVELAAMILGAVGGYGQRAVEELALAQESPVSDVVLVPLLLTITDWDGALFFDALHRALDSDDPGRAARAITLMRAGYGGRFAFPITKEQADALDAQVAYRKALGTTDPRLQHLLANWIRPAVPR